MIMKRKVQRSSLDLRVIKGLEAMMETRVLKVSVPTWGVQGGGGLGGGGGGIPPHGPGHTPSMDESYSFHLPT